MEKKRSLVFSIEDNENGYTDFTLNINGYFDVCSTEQEINKSGSIMLSDIVSAIAYLYERIVTFSIMTGMNPTDSLKLAQKQVTETLKSMLTEED